MIDNWIYDEIDVAFDRVNKMMVTLGITVQDFNLFKDESSRIIERIEEIENILVPSLDKNHALLLLNAWEKNWHKVFNNRKLYREGRVKKIKVDYASL